MIQTLSLLLHHFLGLYSFYRWRQQYGGLRIDQARRLREMEAENGRLRRAVSDLTLDNQILKEAARGNF